MRIFSKKAFLFIRPDAKLDMANAGKETKVRVSPMQFADVPDWVDEDPLFSMAMADNDIEIVSGKAKEKEIETGDNAGSNNAAFKQFAGIKAKELFAKCKELGIECEERQSRDYYIQLLVANEQEDSGNTEDTEE